jgi:hypothetical protein
MKFRNKKPSAKGDSSVFGEMNRTFENTAAKVREDPSLSNASGMKNVGFD